MINWSWKKIDEDTTNIQLLIILLNQRLVKLKDVLQNIIGAIQTTNVFSNGAATPTVYGANLWKVSNTVATNITGFSDGLAGQVITLWSTTANTTIINSATLRTKSGANVALGATGTIAFATYDGTEWREI